MNQELNTFVTGLASAQISLFGILFRHLDNHLGDGIKRDFADELGRIMAVSAQKGEPLPPGQRVIFEQIVEWLKSSERGWTPVVIEGARPAPGACEAAPARHG